MIVVFVVCGFLALAGSSAWIAESCVCVCGCVDVWMCVCVDVWMCGCVDVWMCGCVDAGAGGILIMARFVHCLVG